MRRTDRADREAERLFDMVRDCVDDQKVIDAISDSLRKAAGVTREGLSNEEGEN
jgi:hypothetical protein